MKNLAFLFGGFFLFTCHVFGQFGPAGVGTLVSNGLWLKGDNLTLADGAPVTSWTDGSNYGNNAANGVAAEQPTFNLTGNINGRPTLTFDGTDQLAVPDHAILDGTSGITYYTVVRPTGLNGSPRGILGKRITFTVSTEYAYTYFFHSGNRLNLDLHTQNNRFNTGGTTYSNNINYMTGFTFDGTLPAAQRSKMYDAGTLVVQSTEASTSIPNSNQPLTLGALNFNYGTYFIGEMGEVCHWNYTLNTAERIIVENYLGAKYNIAIANDFYSYQATHAGEVAGIGRVDASNFHNDSQGSAIVRINTPSNLGDNEYLIWGHDEVSILLNDIVDVDGTIIESRLSRTWRADETGDVGTVTVAFDVSGFSPLTGSDLRLLIDRDGDGFADNDVAPISGSFAAGTVTFTGVDLQAGDFFTLGSINYNQTPLPVELLEFDGVVEGENGRLFWSTASEINSDFFTLYHSSDALNWSKIAEVGAAGNSNSIRTYEWLDTEMKNGANFYRLSQTDFDGTEHFFNTVLLNKDLEEVEELIVFPNPSSGDFYISTTENFNGDQLFVTDIVGRTIPANITVGQSEALFQMPNVSRGTYFVNVLTKEGKRISKKVVRH